MIAKAITASVSPILNAVVPDSVRDAIYLNSAPIKIGPLTKSATTAEIQGMSQ